MAYNYIGIVNDVNRRLNEVELTEDNFSTTTGYYSFAKDAVNSSIRHINQEEFEWPWNHVEQTELLLAGTARYSFPIDSKNINMNTFRIKRDPALNTSTQKLKVLAYEEYLDKYADSEYNLESGNRSTPYFVARAPSREFVLYPNPDKDYELVYEYYKDNSDLERPTDIPNLPQQYRHVIVDGAMYYVYQFRGDTQAAQLSFNKFEQGIKHLRSLHINRTDYLRDSRVRF
jgi:hypothetical protein